MFVHVGFSYLVTTFPTMAESNLKAVDARDKLIPRREPYYAKVRAGCYIGFRKMTSTSVGTWLARCRADANDRQMKTSLGDFEDLAKSKRYDAALLEAERWFATVGMNGSTEVKTVKDACKAYATHVKESSGNRDENEAKARELNSRFVRYVYTHKISNIALAKLVMGQVEQWRNDLASKPVTVNPHATKDVQRTRARSASTLNRDMTALRAALNFAKKRGYVSTDVAWLEALTPVKGADKARDVYISKTERKKLLSHVQVDLRPMLEALCLLPLRPGAMAALRVADFEKRLGVLTIGKDKAGRDRKIKLPAHTWQLFTHQCENKLPAAHVFTRSDGKPWDKDSWKKPFKAAAAESGLSDKATTYCLRHSTITDLVPHLDLLTVAQISGTSVQMIQKHYGHLQPSRAVDALAGLAL